MPPHSTNRTKELFLDAIELEGEARTRFLARLERADPEAAAHVRRLLGAHEGQAAEALEGVGEIVDGLMRDQGQPGGTVGNYELVDEIASGASGVVWRATQRSLGRTVALKVLRAGRLAGSKEIERFRAEAEAVARLDHPNIVPVYEVGEHEGRHFFSMRLLSRGSLADQIDSDDTWDARAAAQLMVTVSQAVHHAHQRGLLHRDLKPSNVLLDDDGTPHVADFGVAKQIDDSGIATITATIAGTPAYMAPEQTSPELGELTVATDVWALGCILYELLTGRPPFEGETLVELLRKVRQDEPFPMRALRPDAPQDLETIVLRCLAKEPGRRYASANAVATDLQRWLDHEPILARRTSVAGRLFLAWRRSPLAASLFLVVGVLVVALAIGGSWASYQLSGRLRDAYLEQARSKRLSLQPGHRLEALELLREAAEIRPGPDLRDEAIASLALTDLYPESEVELTRESSDTWIEVGSRMRHTAIREGTRLDIRTFPNGEVIQTYHSDWPCAGLRFSPDESLFAARFHKPGNQATEAVFAVVEVDGGRELLHSPEAVSYNSIDFHPSGDIVAIGTLDGRLVAWHLPSGEKIVDLDLGARTGCIRFRRDGRAIALGVGGGVNQLDVRSFPDGELTSSAPLNSPPWYLAWTEGDLGLAVGCSDYNCYVFDRWSSEPRVVLEGHDAEVVHVFASSTAPLVATNSWDRSMSVWNIRSGEEVLRASASGKAFSDDGSRLIFSTVSSVGTWRVKHGDVFQTLYGHEGKNPRQLAVAPDSRMVVSAGSDGVLLWDLAQGRRIARLSDADCKGVVFLPDPDGALHGGSLLLATDRGLEQRHVQDLTAPGRILIEGRMAHLDASADGRLVAVRVGTDLHLFDPGRPEEVRVIQADLPGFEAVRVSRGGTYVTGGTWAGSGGALWRASDGELLAHLMPQERGVGLMVSPDESRLVVGNGLIYRVYSLPDLAEVATIDRNLGLREPAGLIAFSPDGETLALGMTRKTIRLYDLKTLELRATLEAPTEEQLARMAYSPDGRYLATTSTTNKVSIWNLTSMWQALEEMGLAL